MGPKTDGSDTQGTNAPLSSLNARAPTFEY